MERDQAVRLTQNLLRKMVENKGSDLFITAEFPPAIKIDGVIKPFADRPLSAAQSSLIVRSIMNDKQAKEFDATKECNFAIAPQGIGRFRVSAFVQQGNADWFDHHGFEQHGELRGTRLFAIVPPKIPCDQAECTHAASQARDASTRPSARRARQISSIRRACTSPSRWTVPPAASSVFAARPSKHTAYSDRTGTAPAIPGASVSSIRSTPPNMFPLCTCSRFMRVRPA